MKHCLCNDIIPIDSGIKVVILIHPREAQKQKTGTGRLTHLSIKDSELIRGIDFTNHPRVNELINDPSYFPVLLYPTDDAIKIEDKSLRESLNNKKLLVFILDGTWWHASVMVKESKNIQKLPHITFEEKHISKYIFKKQPRKITSLQ